MDAVLQLNDVIASRHYLLLIGVGISLYLFFTSKSWKLRHIPTAGFSGWPLLSFISTIQFILYGNDLLLEYHERYQGKPFKVAHLTDWFVVLSNGSEDVKEAAKWPESVAQFKPLVDKILRIRFTIGAIVMNEHHLVALVNRLTRHMSNLTLELREELVSSIEDILSPTDEWKSFRLETISYQIVSRVVARMIVGEDLCKNKQFLDICQAYPKQVFKTAVLANVFFPSFLKPYVSSLCIVRRTSYATHGKPSTVYTEWDD
ncbi:hypothetical protein BDQ17DRAFT_1276743 [Cyathus striatus]|nr:hypothetical protein BDQ17DRAFT_1276743 [Cyathus striatus]